MVVGIIDFPYVKNTMTTNLENGSFILLFNSYYRTKNIVCMHAPESPSRDSDGYEVPAF